MNCKPPFHQKVVRTNYEIPEPYLKKCVDLALKNVSELLCCDDYLEVSYQTLETTLSISKSEFFMRFTELVQKPRGVTLGLFDETRSFYMRVYLAPREEFRQNEPYCGGLELFGEEAAMRRIYHTLCNEIDAHFILEGAKKYLEEISEV